MRKRGIFRDKRGTEILTEEIIFIVLNLIFFAALFIFVINSIGGKAYYQQVYAKQVALMLDEMKPGTSILVDISSVAKLAGKKEGIVNVDDTNKKVVVKIVSIGGYSYTYFNNLQFTSKYQSIGDKLYLWVEAENV